MPSAVALKYRAFISYSHADSRRGVRLHRQLEAYRIDHDLAGRVTAMGPVPRQLRPIFRDRDEFTAGAALSEQTIAALDASAALVVLCTPASANSAYVNNEIRLFRSRHPDRPVIPVIAAGAPDHPENECFAPALRFDVTPDGVISDRPVSVLAADLRDAGDGEQLTLAKIVARLTGFGTDEIFRREQRAQRKRQRAWIAGLSAVALGLGGLAIWAEINRREAVRQRAVAERNFATAKQSADSLIFEIAQGLRNQEGMRTETVRKILGASQTAIDDLVKSSGENQELRRSQAGMMLEFADTYGAQGDSVKQAEAIDRGLKILTGLVASDPGNAGWRGDLAVAEAKLGDLHLFRGEQTEALKDYRASLAALQALAAADASDGELQHRLAGAHDRVAVILNNEGQSAAAVAELEQSRTILERIAAEEPANAIWQRDLATAFKKLGDALSSDGKQTDAVERYRKSLAILDRLAIADPGNARWRNDSAIVRTNLGDSLDLNGRHAEALMTFQSAFDSLERLVTSDPSNTDRQYSLAVVRERLADAAFSAGDQSKALDFYRENLATITPIRDRDPKNVLFQRMVGYTLRRQGEILADQGKPVQALKSIEDGLVITRQLAAIDAANTKWQDDLALTLTKLAPLLQARGDTTAALRTLQESLSISERLAAGDATNAERQGTLATTYASTGVQLIMMDRKDEGVVMMRKSQSAAKARLAKGPVEPKFKVFADKIDGILKQLAP